MPYGTGNPEDDKWVEKCVGSITGDYTKGQKIAICKVQLKKKGKSEITAESELSMREELYKIEDKIYKAIEGGGTNPNGERPWLVDIYDNYLVVEFASDLYKVSYSMDGDEVNVDWGTALKVDRKTVYEPASSMSVPSITKQTTHRRITYGPRTI